jgi:hypothetical protein
MVPPLEIPAPNPIRWPELREAAASRESGVTPHLLLKSEMYRVTPGTSASSSAVTSTLSCGYATVTSE